MVEPDNSTNIREGEEMLSTDSTTTATEEESPIGSGTLLSKGDLIKKVGSLYTKHKEDRRWVHLICEELNTDGILTVRGKQWTDQTLRLFIKENKIALKPLSGKKSAAGKTTRVRKSKQPQEPAQGKAKGVRKKKEEPEEKPTPELPKTLLLDEYKPKFRKDIKRDQESIRLSTELVNRAKQRLRNDVPRSGETIRELIELLLWHYLDRPEEFLWMHQGKKW